MRGFYESPVNTFFYICSSKIWPTKWPRHVNQLGLAYDLKIVDFLTLSYLSHLVEFPWRFNGERIIM